MSQAKEIFDGFLNSVFPTEEILQMSKERLEHCFSCPLRNQFDCSRTREGEAVRDFIYKGEQRIKGELYKGCGCFLRQKASSPNSHCPLGNF
jgi:hypothetical protein